MTSKPSKFALIVLIVSLLVTFPVGQLNGVHGAVTNAPLQADPAGSALQEGRRLLKRGRADQALVKLQSALNLYTASKNNQGMAKAHNEIGDLYVRQGQFEVALDHYKKAFDGFVDADTQNQQAAAGASMLDSRLANVNIADDKFNANRMLAKIGDLNFRLGRVSEATASYSRMQVKKPEGAAAKVGRRFGGLGANMGGASTGSVA